MNIIQVIIFLGIALVNASKCPETRKPHVTSCTIFYNCVNLPEGGYVWVPFKCADGLIYQPYLRLCVLPGDSWNCNDYETPESTALPNLSGQLIDQTKTSYSGLIKEDTMSNLIDAYYPVDGFNNLGNVPMIIPYPLIEINSSSNKKNESSKPPNNFNDQFQSSSADHQGFLPLTIVNLSPDKRPNKTQIKSVFSKILFLQNFGPSLNQQNFISPTVYKVNDWIQHFIPNKSEEMESSDLKRNETVVNSNHSTLNENKFVSTAEDYNFDDINPKNTILAVKGNLGQKEYITLEKYKTLIKKVKVEIVEVIPCTRGLRLPNISNCARYYTCEPASAEVYEFICPANTAFNSEINLCDAQKFKECTKDDEMIKESFEKISEVILTEKLVSLPKNKMNETSPCETIGKISDPKSPSAYYLCYSSSTTGKIESLRILCPNGLIFCRERKVCSSKRVCGDSKQLLLL